MTVTLSRKRSVRVSCYAEASAAVRADIAKRGVGASGWYGKGAGRVFVCSKETSHVSYNGRVWEGPDIVADGRKEIQI